MEFIDNEPSNIWVASSDGDLDRVKQLISEGVSVNAQDETGFSPIHAASSYGQMDVLRYLLSIGANPNLLDDDGDTPLLVCELPEVFELLRAAGSNPDAINHHKEGLIQKAVEDENEDLIKYLLENGHVKDPNFKFTPGQFELNMHDEGFDAVQEGEEGEEEEQEEDNMEDAN